MIIEVKYKITGLKFNLILERQKLPCITPARKVMDSLKKIGVLYTLDAFVSSVGINFKVCEATKEASNFFLAVSVC